MYGEDEKKISLSGKIVKAAMGGTSKGAHKAFVLQTEKKQIKLRREGGNPFYDDFFEKFENEQVDIEGFDMGQYFLVTTIHISGQRGMKKK